MRTIFKITVFILLLIVSGCGNSPKRENFIIGISSDIQTFNPAFAVSVTEGNLSELFYLGLVGYNWNESKGTIEPYPLLAEKWEWSKDSSSVVIKINSKAKWSDGIDLTADDIVFTYDIYSDPIVQSKFFDTFECFDLNKDQSIDLKKTFEIISPKEIRINFKKSSVPSTFNFDLPLIPKHIFQSVDRKELANSELNLKPVGSGPYDLADWKKNQYIKLKLNPNSFLAEKGSVKELIFKVVPDYNSRIIQLKKSEIDFAEELKWDDVKDIKENKNISVSTVWGRDYDYIGLNNIDCAKFEKGVIEGNRFFADSLVRKAVAIAVDRDMIVSEFLGGYGKTAVTPVAPIFKSIIDTTLKPFKYSPKTAKELLDKAGWKDSNNDGILDKNGKPFSFHLAIQGGNKTRSEIATIVKDNLKQAGIEVVIDSFEPSVFVEKMFGRKFDAFISGWQVPIPVDLKPYWNSDLKNNPANTVGYRNRNVDAMLDRMKSRVSNTELKKYYYDFEKAIYNEVPAVFLFWSYKIIAFNKRLSNHDFSPLGTIHYCWKWRLAE